MNRTPIITTPWAAAALAVTALTLSNPTAHASTVWNVNMAGTTAAAYSISTSDNYFGAATENTANSN